MRQAGYRKAMQILKPASLSSPARPICVHAKGAFTATTVEAPFTVSERLNESY
jgi:hypothetical protein